VTLRSLGSPCYAYNLLTHNDPPSPHPQSRQSRRRQLQRNGVYLQPDSLRGPCPHFRSRKAAYCYIRQLRAVRHPRSATLGPLATKEPRIFQSPIFGQVVENRGPFASYRELASLFNDRLRMAYEGEPLPNIGIFDDSAPLVLPLKG
jgi:hypothetical protein